MANPCHPREGAEPVPKEVVDRLLIERDNRGEAGSV
jgi:hypothetical protein